MSTYEQKQAQKAMINQASGVPAARKDDIFAFLTKKKDSIAAVMPKFMNPERMMKVALANISKNPELAKCSPISVLRSLMQAAEVGLEPSSATGLCYLIPYKNECTLQFGYQGLMDLARRGGKVKSIDAEVVYTKDKFVYRKGLMLALDHEQCLDEDRGEFKCVYAIANFGEGINQFVILSRFDVNKIKAASQSANSASSPWNKWYDEMAKKSAIKRLCKLLPKNVELEKALAQENAAESGDHDSRADANALFDCMTVEPETGYKTIDASEGAEASEEKAEETAKEQSEFDAFKG